MGNATAKSKLQTITEQADDLGGSLKVDREAGLIRGVKILGLRSKNGREYLAEAARRAMPLYEGRVVNTDHLQKPGATRSVRDRLGEFVNVTQDANGELYGDLKYIKSHDMAERVCEAAERGLKVFGMSHDVQGRTKTKDGKCIVEEIVSVTSVDLVADPATTKNLFEHVETTEGADAVELQEALAKITELTTANAALVGEKAKLVEEIDAFKAEKKAVEHKAAVAALLTEHKIPDAARTKEFVAILEGATIENATAAVKSLAETLKSAGGKPKSVSGGAHLSESKGNGSGGSNSATYAPDAESAAKQLLRR